MRSSALGVGKDGFSITTTAATKSKWHFLRASGKSFLICDMVQHLCLDAYGRRANGDAPILFSRRNAGPNQRWELVNNNGAYTFANQANQLFLDVASCSRFSNSTNAVMGQQSVSNCQKWNLKEIPKPKPPTSSTFTKSHSVSFSESAKKTESFTRSDETRTKTQSATISQQGTDKVSSSRTIRDSRPYTQSYTMPNVFQPNKTVSATRQVVDTGTKQQVYTGTKFANKTRTATHSVKASTFTRQSKSKIDSRNIGPSFSTHKTRSEGPPSKPTASYTYTLTEAKRSTQSYTATDATRSKSRTATATAFKTQAASTIITFRPQNGTATASRQILVSVPQNKTRTATVTAPDTAFKSVSYSKTMTKPVGTSFSASATKSDGPTRSVSVTQTLIKTSKGDNGAPRKTFSESRTVSVSSH